MAKRGPSSSQIHARLRAAQQKAERQNRDAVRKFERDLNRSVKDANDKANRELQRRVDRVNQQLRANPPKVTYTVRAVPRHVRYTTTERSYLGDIRDSVAQDQAVATRERDLFLCHAWADRRHSANDFHEALVNLGVDSWFSERDVTLGMSLARQLDRGIRSSRVGVVLVTPAMLMALSNGGLADQELGALLATNRVIPVLHEVTYEELRAESPLLAARAGLTTSGSSLTEVAEKIADAVLGTAV